MRLLPDLSETDIYRFWCYVKKHGPDNCWDWLSTGGIYYIGANIRPMFGYQKGKYLVTRVIWKITTGVDPDKLLVLHTCSGDGKGGNKCINPNHLYLGTYSDNSIDRCSNNPDLNKGSNHPCSILIESQVNDIRNSLKTQRQLAKYYGVSKGTIGLIISRKTWKHI